VLVVAKLMRCVDVTLPVAEKTEFRFVS